MTAPPSAEIDAALAATWPAARSFRLGCWTIRDGAGGGKRVDAATLDDVFDPGAIGAAEAAMDELGRAPLFRVRAAESTLDDALAGRGYRALDPTVFYLAPVSGLMNPGQHPLDAVTSETRLGIEADIWAEGGVGRERLDVMDRAAQPKTWLLARLDDRAAGAGFAAIHGRLAMVHALETLARYRRRGAARAMMHRAARWAAASGATHLCLAVTEGNTAANSLYTSLGMRRAGGYVYRRRDEGHAP